MEDNYREVKKAEPCLKLIHMDQVEVEEIEWLFYPFIPYVLFGKLNAAFSVRLKRVFQST